jgi:hypothetical protein
VAPKTEAAPGAGGPRDGMVAPAAGARYSMGVGKEMLMRAIPVMSAALAAVLMLSGCGSEKPAKKAAPPADAAPASGNTPSPPPPAKDSGPMIPGDPGTAIKIYKRGQDAARKLEDKSRETAGGADAADEGK